MDSAAKFLERAAIVVFVAFMMWFMSGGAAYDRGVYIAHAGIKVHEGGARGSWGRAYAVKMDRRFGCDRFLLVCEELDGALKFAREYQSGFCE